LNPIFTQTGTKWFSKGKFWHWHCGAKKETGYWEEKERRGRKERRKEGRREGRKEKKDKKKGLL
jgi:hypothetical protein